MNLPYQKISITMNLFFFYLQYSNPQFPSNKTSLGPVSIHILSLAPIIPARNLKHNKKLPAFPASTG